MWLDQGGQAAKLTERFDFHPHNRKSSGQSEATSLVPLERHHAVSRRQFILGIFLGALAAVLITVLVFRFSNGSSNNGSEGATEPAPAIPPSSVTGLKTPSSPGANSIPVVAAPPERFQYQARPSLAIGSYKESASRTMRPQAGALIPAGQQVPWTSKSQSRSEAGKNDSRTNSAASLDELWSSVRVGNVNAMIVLADRYARGDGAAANCAQARVLLTTASNKGSTEAARSLQQLDDICSPATPQ